MTNTYVTPFSRSLTELLERIPHGRADLASGISVSSRLVGYWCAGEREPNLTQLCLIRAFLGVDLDWLVSGEEPKVIANRKLLGTLAGRIKIAAQREADLLVEECG